MDHSASIEVLYHSVAEAMQSTQSAVLRAGEPDLENLKALAAALDVLQVEFESYLEAVLIEMDMEGMLPDPTPDEG